MALHQASSHQSNNPSQLSQPDITVRLKEFISELGQIVTPQSGEIIFDIAILLAKNFISQMSLLTIDHEEFVASFDAILRHYVNPIADLDVPLYFAFRPADQKIVLRFDAVKGNTDVEVLDVSGLSTELLICLPTIWVTGCMASPGIGKTVHQAMNKQVDTVIKGIVLSNDYVAFIKDGNRGLKINGQQPIDGSETSRPAFVDPDRELSEQDCRCLNAYAALLDTLGAQTGIKISDQQTNTIFKLCSQRAFPYTASIECPVFCSYLDPTVWYNVAVGYEQDTDAVALKLDLETSVINGFGVQYGLLRWETTFSIAQNGAVGQVHCAPSDVVFAESDCTDQERIYLKCMNANKRELEIAFELCSMASIQNTEMNISQYWQSKIVASEHDALRQNESAKMMTDTTSSLDIYSKVVPVAPHSQSKAKANNQQPVDKVTDYQSTQTSYETILGYPPDLMFS